MEKKNGLWTIKFSTQKYKNEFIEVIEDAVFNPDKSKGTYATVRMKPGVCILPIDDKGNVYLTKQFRYALGEDSLEMPCEGMKDGSSPLENAKREAKEELGIEAGVTG